MLQENRALRDEQRITYRFEKNDKHPFLCSKDKNTLAPELPILGQITPLKLIS